VPVGVVDANIVIGWMQGAHRSAAKIERLFASCRAGHVELFISVVNLAEVVRHTLDLSKATGVDPVTLLSGTKVNLHRPDEAVAFRVARLPCSLADGFAAATALELGARLHTSDRELAAQLKGRAVPLTIY
jgi:predicted nucleic acid-binding protein